MPRGPGLTPGWARRPAWRGHGEARACPSVTGTGRPHPGDTGHPLITARSAAPRGDEAGWLRRPGAQATAGRWTARSPLVARRLWGLLAIVGLTEGHGRAAARPSTMAWSGRLGRLAACPAALPGWLRECHCRQYGWPGPAQWATRHTCLWSRPGRPPETPAHSLHDILTRHTAASWGRPPLDASDPVRLASRRCGQARVPGACPPA
jgi:hypothetical protein